METVSENALSALSREELIARVQSLQNQIDTLTKVENLGEPKDPKISHNSDSYYPSKSSKCIRTKIALLFSYQGSQYSGLAYTKIPDGKPTVEELILRSLIKSKLVDPAYSEDGQLDLQHVLDLCDWERCGRTDAGVSSAGQVIDLRVWTRKRVLEDGREEVEHLPYPTILNKGLPPTIRVHGWSPVSEEFSSRHSCKFRHYKYFFTSSLSPPSIPLHGEEDENTQEKFSRIYSNVDLNTVRTMTIDVSLMQQAASYFVGTHDFRNFCRIDPSKQLTHHIRNIYRSSIEQVDDQIYCFNLVGSGFLYNQVRHMMAILFLIGQRLEDPSLVKRLLYTSHTPPLPPTFFPQYTTTRQFTEASDPSLIPNEKIEGDREGWEKIDTKPIYDIADGEPLMLWACGFDKEDLDWQFDALLPSRSSPAPESTKISFKAQSLYAQMSNASTSLKIEALLADHAMIAFMNSLPSLSTLGFSGTEDVGSRFQQSYFPKSLTRTSFLRYVPILKRKRGEDFEIVNRRYLEGKGRRRQEKLEARKIAKGDGSTGL